MDKETKQRLKTEISSYQEGDQINDELMTFFNHCAFIDLYKFDRVICNAPNTLLKLISRSIEIRDCRPMITSLIDVSDYINVTTVILYRCGPLIYSLKMDRFYL